MNEIKQKKQNNYVKKPYVKKTYSVVKYRKSIIEAMDPEKIKKYGFDKSYFIFERSINNMQKEGDVAEDLAFEYLKSEGLLSENYRLNKVIALGTIKIEADIVDFDNKVVYETKSRKQYEVARKAIKDKWRLFEYDKKRSIYKDFEFKGIVVENRPEGPKVKGVVTFEKASYDNVKMQAIFDKHLALVKELKLIKKEVKKNK